MIVLCLDHEIANLSSLSQCFQYNEVQNHSLIERPLAGHSLSIGSCPSPYLHAMHTASHASWGGVGFTFTSLSIASSASDGRTGEAPSLLSALRLKGSSCSDMFLLVGFLPGLSQSPAAPGLRCPLILGSGQGCCSSSTMHSSPTQGFLPQHISSSGSRDLGGRWVVTVVCLSITWDMYCVDFPVFMALGIAPPPGSGATGL